MLVFGMLGPIMNKKLPLTQADVSGINCEVLLRRFALEMACSKKLLKSSITQSPWADGIPAEY